MAGDAEGWTMEGINSHAMFEINKIRKARVSLLSALQLSLPHLAGYIGREEFSTSVDCGWEDDNNRCVPTADR
jgi:hypothetical protein